MKTAIFSLVFLMATQSFAGGTFECSLVEDFDDWSVSVSLDREEVLFWDNDDTSEGSLFRVLKSQPPIYVFKSTNPNDPWQFEFSEIENEQGYLSGKLTLLGDSEARVHEMNCSEVQDDQD